MWVFGYGSLTWDGWETTVGCVRRVVAELPGFRRTFDKGSVRNWGSADNPCPTLNLAADPSRTCKGVAFEFPEARRQELIAYLKGREGKGFHLRQTEIEIEKRHRVSAVVAIYSEQSLLCGKSTDERAAMARTAEGDRGRCIDYVRNIAMKLAELGIDDRDVNEFWHALKPQVSGAKSPPP